MPKGNNYITLEGFKRLQAELFNLIKHERPNIVEIVSWAAGNGDRSENGDYIYGKKKLRQIDSRIKFLTSVIEDADIIQPNQQINTDQIDKIINETMVYALNFDLQTPNFNDVKVVSVHQILDMNNNQKLKTSKRMGYKFSFETNND